MPQIETGHRMNKALRLGAVELAVAARVFSDSPGATPVKALTSSRTVCAPSRSFA